VPHCGDQIAAIVALTILSALLTITSSWGQLMGALLMGVGFLQRYNIYKHKLLHVPQSTVML
jgi:hypothetical protein